MKRRLSNNDNGPRRLADADPASCEGSGDTLREKDAVIGERLRFEQMISDLSARFINVPAERLDGEIENALKKVLEFFEVDRCGLLHTLPGRDSWKITHVAYSENAAPVPIGTALPRSIHPWAYDRLTVQGEVVAYERVENMPDEAHVDKRTWIDWGIRSNLTIPILTKAALVHIISINSVHKERAWPEAYIPRLQLLGEILVNALERRDTEQALRDSEERVSLATSLGRGGNLGHECRHEAALGHRQAAGHFSFRP